MTLRLEYDLVLDPSSHVDRIVAAVRAGLLAHRTDSRAEIDMAYRMYANQEEPRLSLSVNLELASFGMAERGSAGLVALLGGTSFRDPAIRSVTLSAFSIMGNDTFFPGPVRGSGLLDSSASPAPWLSVPVPKTAARQSWDSVSRTLVRSGVQVLTDLSLNVTDYELTARAAAVSEEVTAGRPVALFFNATSRLEYAVRLVEKIATTLQPQVPNVAIGVRMCPVAMGFSVFEYLRAWNVPIFAYTLTSYPSGHTSWSQSAYASMINAMGGDVVNIGLLSIPALRRGTLYEAIMPLLNRRNTGKASLPALTGGIEPRVAYEYATAIRDPVLLHTMTPVFRGGLERRSIRKRVKAIREAVEAGRQSLDIERLFAERNPSVRNWQEIEEER
ncbi:hypothetical protein ABT186_36320 [Streptomyces sp. NPDC001634]|uniref:hypothetical protein n=1 Tax=Streptomyces sp. NPDC001634 TaxID=3154390 RepID=UPI00332B4697